MVVITVSCCDSSNTFDYGDSYMFNYDVHSQENKVKQNFGQKEQRNDDNEVTGEW